MAARRAQGTPAAGRHAQCALLGIGARSKCTRDQSGGSGKDGGEGDIAPRQHGVEPAGPLRPAGHLEQARQCGQPTRFRVELRQRRFPRASRKRFTVAAAVAINAAPNAAVASAARRQTHESLDDRRPVSHPRRSSRLGCAQVRETSGCCCCCRCCCRRPPSPPRRPADILHSAVTRPKRCRRWRHCGGMLLQSGCSTHTAAASTSASAAAIVDPCHRAAWRRRRPGSAAITLRIIVSCSSSWRQGRSARPAAKVERIGERRQRQRDVEPLGAKETGGAAADAAAANFITTVAAAASAAISRRRQRLRNAKPTQHSGRRAQRREHGF